MRTGFDRRVGIVVAMLAGLVALVPAPAALAASPCGSSGAYTVAGVTATCTYSYTGTEDTFSVPAGVSSLSVTAVGAPGGAGAQAGGLGAQVTNPALPVEGGAELYVDVGQSGGPFPDGGSGGGGSGGGGGSSTLLSVPRAIATLNGNVTDSSLPVDSRLLVAGGGGGASSYAGAGGDAGDATAVGGGGGNCSNSAGGTGGVGPTDGTNGGGGSCGGGTSGTAASGGNGASPSPMNLVYGGGGGGGWFGGGGGGFMVSLGGGGGGGGSSYGGAGCTAACVTEASSSQAPEVTISWMLPSLRIGQQSTSVSTPSSSDNPSLPGQSVTFTATVTPAPDGGTVHFTDPGKTIPGCGAVAVNTSTGKASCTTRFNSVGRYGVQAVYSGDGSFSGSQSQTFTQVVARKGTSLRLRSSADSVRLDRQVTFTAWVSPAPDGGQLTFLKNGHAIPGCVNVPVSSTGKATCQWTFSRAGARTIKVRYTGTPQFAASTSTPLTETIRGRPKHEHDH